MELPKVTNVPLPDHYISEALAKNLDEDGLLRLRSVEEAVRLSMNSNIGSPDKFEELINKIYKFYVTTTVR